jgi:flavin-dependent dehydrogenase
MPERDSLEMDVVFVGAGPANLSGALHLARLVANHNKGVEDGTLRWCSYSIRGRDGPTGS